MDELYALYRRCFPDYPAAEAVFRECLKRERGQVLYAGEGGETVGYALIHGGSLSLLCVDRRYRNRGHGAALLEAAETRIRASGGGPRPARPGPVLSAPGGARGGSGRPRVL